MDLYGATVVVTVCVPTWRGRGVLLRRALESVRAQEGVSWEAVVVGEAGDAEGRAVVESFGEERLRWVEVAPSSGANQSRNRAVEVARGRWIAFLDDDDEWFPGKLVAQVAVAEGALAGGHWPVVGCQVWKRTPRVDRALPRCLPVEGEVLSDYLFVRRGVFHGDGLVQTSSLLVPRALCLRVPWGAEEFWHEAEWFLRVAAVPGVVLRVLPEVFVVWHCDEDRRRVSRESVAVRAVVARLLELRDLFTRRSYAAFLASVFADGVSGRGERWVWPWIVREMRERGAPAWRDWVLLLYIALCPRGWRRVWRDRLFRLSRCLTRAKP